MQTVPVLQHTLPTSLPENPPRGDVAFSKIKDFFFFFSSTAIAPPKGQLLCSLCNWAYTWGFVNTTMAVVGVRKKNLKKKIVTEDKAKHYIVDLVSH